MADLDDVPDVGHGGGILVLPLDVTDVPHHHVDDGVLNQAEEHEQGAGRHEHVNGLDTDETLLSFIIVLNISYAATFQRMGLLGIQLIIS